MTNISTINDYIEYLKKFEEHPLGQTQFENMDFDFYPMNRPIGFALQSDATHCVIMAGCELNLRLYRGENKDNPDFSPTIKRNGLKPGDLKHCFEWIKTEEFKNFFKESIYYKMLSEIDIEGFHFEPNLDAIAQHYDFKTNYLDLTQSRLVAQFFAMTYYDEEKSQILPIKDFTHYKPIIYDIKITDLYKLKPQAFKIIGIQPLWRPLQQFAYAIDTSIFEEDLKKYFNRTEMKPDPEGARWTYNYFNGGKTLLPDERIQDSIDKLKHTKFNNKIVVQEHLLFEYCKNFKLNFNEYRSKMSKLYYVTDKKKFVMFPNEIEIVKNYLQSSLIPFIKKSVVPFNENYLMKIQ